jgi:hypothetical protein
VRNEKGFSAHIASGAHADHVTFVDLFKDRRFESISEF